VQAEFGSSAGKRRDADAATHPFGQRLGEDAL